MLKFAGEQRGFEREVRRSLLDGAVPTTPVAPQVLSLPDVAAVAALGRLAADQQREQSDGEEADRHNDRPYRVAAAIRQIAALRTRDLSHSIRSLYAAIKRQIQTRTSVETVTVLPKRESRAMVRSARSANKATGRATI